MKLNSAISHLAKEMEQSTKSVSVQKCQVLFLHIHHNLSTVYTEIIRSGCTAGLTPNKEGSQWKILVWSYICF